MQFLISTTLKCRRGQGMSEYLILVLLIAVTSIAATKTVGTAVKGRLKEVKTKIEHLGVQSGDTRADTSGDGMSGEDE